MCGRGWNGDVKNEADSSESLSANEEGTLGSARVLYLRKHFKPC